MLSHAWRLFTLSFRRLTLVYVIYPALVLNERYSSRESLLTCSLKTFGVRNLLVCKQILRFWNYDNTLINLWLLMSYVTFLEFVKNDGVVDFLSAIFYKRTLLIEA